MGAFLKLENLLFTLSVDKRTVVSHTDEMSLVEVLHKVDIMLCPKQTLLVSGNKNKVPCYMPFCFEHYLIRTYSLLFLLRFTLVVPF